MNLQDFTKCAHYRTKLFQEMLKKQLVLLFKMKEMWTYMSLNFDDSHKCAKLIRKAQNLYKYNLAVNEIFEKYELK